MRSAEPVPRGVSFLDHTADVGLEVTAPTLAELFMRTASGMACLIHGSDFAGDARAGATGDVRDAGTPGVAAAPGVEAVSAGASGGGPLVERRLVLSADDLPALMRTWLRELLHLHEAGGLAPRGASFPVLTETRLEAIVELAPDTFGPIREIKGVTLHGLTVERRGEGWVGRVIFDV